MKLFVALGSLVAFAFLTTTISAQDAKCPCKSKETTVAAKTCTAETCTKETCCEDKACTAKACTAETCTKDTCCEGKCPVETAMAKLPKMTYLVGTESTCCSEQAAKLAKEHSQPITFVVAEKKFDDKTAAFASLVESTEKYVTEFTSPHTCSVSGTTTVAGKACSCSVEAGKRAELVKSAVEQVKMTYKVGTESACCSQSAAAMAKKSGEKMVFVVAGEETCCNHTARLNLARAKYAAAVKATLATNEAGEKATTETKSTAPAATTAKKDS